jgi:hypothetical protein
LQSERHESHYCSQTKKKKKKLPEQKSSHQKVVAPDLLSYTSLLCSLSSTTEPQLKFVRRWKKEKKVRKYPTSKKKKKREIVS